MRHHDIRMALAAIVAFGPVVFAAAYGVASAARLQAASAPFILVAPVQAAAMRPEPLEERAMAEAPQSAYQITPMVSVASLGIVTTGLDRPRSKHQVLR
jgi:hypothetical protein